MMPQSAYRYPRKVSIREVSKPLDVVCALARVGNAIANAFEALIGRSQKRIGAGSEAGPSTTGKTSARPPRSAPLKKNRGRPQSAALALIVRQRAQNPPSYWRTKRRVFCNDISPDAPWHRAKERGDRGPHPNQR